MLTQKRPIRQSQLVLPWGIGQIIPFPEGECLMLCGLDAWESNSYDRAKESINEYIINDERLAKLLDVSNFRLPPDYREYESGIRNAQIKIPFIRFPQWHYCPRCGNMEKVSIFSPKLEYCQNCKNHDKKYKWIKLIPVSFVAICEQGHIQDFPFLEWVHKDNNPQENCKLTFKPGPYISVKCSCGEHNKMTDIYREKVLNKIMRCQGNRPWLAEVDNKSACNEELKVVPISASNVYFPHIYSSIYLPNYEKSVHSKITKILDNKWAFIKKRSSGGEIDKGTIEYIADDYKIDFNTLYRVAQERLQKEKKRKIESKNPSEEEYRLQEYLSIINGEGGDNQDFFVTNQNSNNYDNIINKYFKQIALIHKLRETKAFYGFSRLLPNDDKSWKQKKSELSKSNKIDWLPAAVFYGEGIFFEFDDKLINDWEKNNLIQQRTLLLKNNFQNSFMSLKGSNQTINPRLILLHTFAHIIINQLSYVCGYSSASLRERIYCNTISDVQDMNGVLIYTASGDTDGSLGGLVRQGKPGNLESVVVTALQSASWCSADPICIQSTGQGPDSCNLAACHNCALLPESSCEKANRYLDRGMLIGTDEESDIGFFSDFRRFFE